MEQEEAVGTCHICKGPGKGISYCPVCEHWFCPECRGRYWARGLEAVKQLIGGRKVGCCGPAIATEAA